jgi:hypothetical protein
MYELYPSPSSQNFTSFNSLFTYVNTTTGGFFGWFLLMCIYLIFAFGVSFYKRDIGVGVAIAGFVTIIIGVLFRILDLINNVTLGITIAVAMGSLLILIFNKTKE